MTPAPVSTRRTPQPMYSTSSLENLAALMLPSAEPEASAFTVTLTGVIVTNPASAADEVRTSAPIAINCFVLMVTPRCYRTPHFKTGL